MMMIRITGAVLALFFAILVPRIGAAANPVVAIHTPNSGTQTLWSAVGWKAHHPNRYLKEALRSDGTPFVELSDAQIASGALFANGSPKYPILFSINAETISDQTANTILGYVQAGGHVYVGGSSWTRTETGARRVDGNGQPAFALGAQMGLRPLGWVFSYGVVVEQSTRAVDHLDAAVPYPWHTAAAYDEVSFSPTRRIYAAAPTASNPASPMLAALIDGVPIGSSLSGGLTVDPAAWQGNGAALRFANVDGDRAGRQDMIYRVDGMIYVRLATESGYAAPTIWTSWNPAYDYRLADVNGDRKADLVGRSEVDIQVGLSTGNGFQPSTAWTYWGPGYDHHLADVNGDGKADLIGRSGSRVEVSLSSGTHFPSSQYWTYWGSAYDLQLADVNGDGRADIVGRSVTNIEAGISSGFSFFPSTSWTYWGTGYDYRLADMDGDGRADIVGKSVTPLVLNGKNYWDVQVGRSSGANFLMSTSWTIWSSSFSLTVSDFDGDGRNDIVGCKCNSVPNPDFPYDGDVQIGLSNAFAPGTNLFSFVKLARKPYGTGLFIYNADVTPLAGNGGFANDNSEYKIVRRAIEDAFASGQTPMIALAPWPFPNRSAMIYRHDHWLARDIHELEASLVPASGAFGEYYVLPDQANEADGCTPSSANDYPEEVAWATGNRALIGAHNVGHALLELLHKVPEAEARQRADFLLQEVSTRIQNETGGRMSPIYVAPAYVALQKTSMEAIWAAGFKTTGEQGVGPFPHFAIDHQTTDGRIGALLQVPTSEWPGYDNVERMIVVDPVSTYQQITLLKKAANLSYQLGGLINVYDHAAGDPYGYFQPGTNRCDYSRKVIAENLIRYVTQTLDDPAQRRIWYTNSIDIRDWWLMRNSRQPAFVWQRTASGTTMEASIAVGTPIDNTPITPRRLGLRITLDPTSRAHAQNRIRVYTDSVLREDVPGCQSSAYTRCSSQDPDLYVLVGDASTARVVLGNP